MENPGLNYFFPRVAVITLDQRKEYITTTMERMNVDITHLFPAILGSSLDRTQLIQSNIIAPDCRLNLNEIACALSHLSVIQEFYNTSFDNDETLFIFEDDIVYDPNYFPRLATIMRDVPSDWDFIQFGHCYSNCKSMALIRGQVYKSSNPLCCHSYAITRRCAHTILQHCSRLAVAIDVYYIQLMQQEKINYYTVYPLLFSQLKAVMSSPSAVFTSTLGNFDSAVECYPELILADTNHSFSNITIVLVLVLLLVCR